MSFHFILPSNTSPETFPNNNASFYSTPLDKPLMLDGDWEVGVLTVDHSNCINTFNNDIITVVDKKRKLVQVRHPTKLTIPPPPPSQTPTTSTTTSATTQIYETREHYLKDLIERLNKLLKGIIRFSLNARCTTISYEMHTKQHYLYLSPTLQRAFGLNNCLAQYDFVREGTIALRAPSLSEENCFMVLIPVDSPREIITLDKKSDQKWSYKVLVETIHSQLTRAKYPYARLNVKTNRFETDSPTPLVSLDWPLLAAIGDKELQRILDDYNDGLIVPMAHFENLKLTLYPLNDATEYVEGPLVHRIMLEPRRFRSKQHLCEYVTKRINYDSIVLSQKDGVAQLSISTPHLQLTFDKDVQDILAFDRQTYVGKCDATAADTISLTRRIDYFYVYSNIGEFVHIGNTEAPLLCVFPYNAAAACGIITERNFKLPSYVQVKGDQFAQIDIGVYDGAGKPVPFQRDARTVVQLHFRRRRRRQQWNA